MGDRLTGHRTGPLWGLSAVPEPSDQVIQLACARIESASGAKNADLLAQLRSEPVTEQNFDRSCELVCLLVTNLRKAPPAADPPTGDSPWARRFETANRRERERLSIWTRRAAYRETAAHLIELYNADYGQTRTMVELVLSHRSFPPLPDYMLLLAVRDMLGADADAMAELCPPGGFEALEHYIRDLLVDDRLARWVSSLPARLKHFGGSTNTMVGLYDWISYPEFASSTGYDLFPRHPDVAMDLGGGFGTPDVSRLLGRTLISCDLLRPKKAARWKLLFRELLTWRRPRMGIGDTRLLSTAEHKRYYERLKRTPWVHFDVFRHRFPMESRSYFITSFGFLSSTVGTLSRARPRGLTSSGRGFLTTTYMAVRRVMELVVAGKEVDLFCYQRAIALDYRNRTLFLSYRDRDLIQAVAWPHDEAPIDGRVTHMPRQLALSPPAA